MSRTVKRLRRALPALSLAACAALAGCSGTEAAPASNASVPLATDAPLDVSAYLDDPCALAPESALTKLGYREAGTALIDGEIAQSIGPGCFWSANNGTAMTVQIQSGYRDAGRGGLPGLEAAHRAGELAFLEPAPAVAGAYQAYYGGPADRRADGDCTLVVGIAPDLVLSVAAQSYTGPEDSCAEARQVAEVAIGTLRS